LDEDGEEYSERISENIIQKLKMALGIPLHDEEGLETLKDFFGRKFKNPQYPDYFNNMKDEPELEMLNAKIFGHLSELNDKRGKAVFDATKLKE
jgi:hypothetical protein